LVTPVLTHFCDLTVELADIMEMGDGRAGKRRIIPIIGGTVRGPKINGKILNLGADWQTVFSDGMAELDTRYAFETDDGALIEIRNFGYRHGSPEVIAAVARGEPVDSSQYYMRTHARLETGDERYAWVNRMLFVGAGGRNKNSVEIALYAVE
jgi:imidazole glycerol phosphate synthase subunit HisF